MNIDGILFSYIDNFYHTPIYHSEYFKEGIAACKLVTDTTSNYMILIGNELNYFTQEELEVIYWHEVGHIKSNHLGTIKEKMQKEYEADSFSINEVGADRLIKVLLKTIPLCKSQRGVTSIKKRIKRALHIKSIIENIA